MNNKLEIVLTAKNHTEKTFAQVQKRLGTLTSSVFSLNGAVVTLAGGAGIGMLAKGFLQTARDFERYEVMLETITGSSEKAKQSMDWIADFTKRTPYELNKVTDAFVKLSAFGLSGTRWLSTLGDTASSMGKTLDQSVEMFTDAVTGEFERLKEFGIKASTQGDKVKFRWAENGKDMVISTEKTQAGISSALEKIFSRFSGGMEKQSKTLDGVLSNIKDQFVMLQKTIMDAGVFAEIKTQVGYISKEFAGWVEANDDLIKQNVPVYIANTKEAVKKAYHGLMDMKDLYDSIPDDIKGAAGYGVIGSILLGKKGGALVGSLAFLTGELKDFAEGVEGLFSGKITAGEFFGDEREFEAALARKRRQAEEIAKATKGLFTRNPKTDNHANINQLEQIIEYSKRAQKELSKMGRFSPKINLSSINKSLSDFYYDIKKTEDNYRQFLKNKKQAEDAFAEDYRQATMSIVELDKFNLKQRYDDYATFITDKQKLNEWYSLKLEEINKLPLAEVQANLESMSVNVNGLYSSLNDKPFWSKFRDGGIKALEEISQKTLSVTDMVASGITQLVDGVGDAFGQWASGAKSFKDAFKDMARSVVSSLISMIAKQMIFNALQNSQGKGGSGGGWFSSILGFLKHTGGVGQREGDGTRALPAFAYNNAPRLHQGLLPGEYTAILKDDEGVFTPKQMSALGKRSNTANVQVNVINQTGTKVKAKQSQPKWDGKKQVIGIILEAVQENKGGFRNNMRAALGGA